MTWRSDSLPPVAETAAAMVKAAFPDGPLDVDLHPEFGCLDDDAAVADLSAQRRGRPGEVAPWRVALGTVLQSMEGRTDRQAADAVRRGMDGTSALRRDLRDPGFTFPWWPDFRER